MPFVEVPEEQTVEFSVLIIGVLVILTVGLGCTLTIEDAKKAFKTPRAPMSGIVAQFLWLPLVGFILAKIFDFPPYVAIGLITVTSSPGGTTSNFFSYLGYGDVALSVIMTGISVTLSFGLTPLLLYLYSSALLKSDEKIEVPFFEIFKTLLSVAIPCGVGVLIRAKSTVWAKRVEVVGTIVGLLFLTGAVILGIMENSSLFSLSWEYWLTAFAILPLGYLGGSLVGMCIGLPAYQARTVGFEVGVQDTIVSIAIIRLSFTGTDMVQALVFPLLCSLWDVINSLVAWLLIWLYVRKYGSSIPVDDEQDKKTDNENAAENDEEIALKLTETMVNEEDAIPEAL